MILAFGDKNISLGKQRTETWHAAPSAFGGVSKND
jgi:hypothetical protein